MDEPTRRRPPCRSSSAIKPERKPAHRWPRVDLLEPTGEVGAMSIGVQANRRMVTPTTDRIDGRDGCLVDRADLTESTGKVSALSIGAPANGEMAARTGEVGVSLIGAQPMKRWLRRRLFRINGRDGRPVEWRASRWRDGRAGEGELSGSSKCRARKNRHASQRRDSRADG